MLDHIQFKDIMQSLAACEQFVPLATRLFPEYSAEQLRQQVLGIADIHQFQSVVMRRGCQWVAENTMSEFTYSGVEYLDGSPCLFISNHRDIVLDAMMLQYILVSNGFETSHVVVGSNLFEMDLMRLMAQANKMYGIDRGGTPREYYNGLMQMSQFLRQQVTECGESVWIAQRNGRTKDGKDRTDPALIKMIAASGDRTNPVEALDAMHIVPVSVSYEWEPCGLLKARELCLRQQGPYTKAPGEDTESIIRGVMDFKGRVHFSICEPLRRDELAVTMGDFNAIATLLDERISAGFRRWPNHYIAKQMLEGSVGATGDEAVSFQKYIDEACTRFPLGDEFRRILLEIYANAVV